MTRLAGMLLAVALTGCAIVEAIRSDPALFETTAMTNCVFGPKLRPEMDAAPLANGTEKEAWSTEDGFRCLDALSDSERTFRIYRSPGGALVEAIVLGELPIAGRVGECKNGWCEVSIRDFERVWIDQAESEVMWLHTD